jgi:hypothetical protein
MRFLLLEYSNKHRSYLNIQLKKLEHSKVLKCVHIPIVVNHAGCFVAIYYLTKDGYDLLDSYSE